MSTRLSEIVVRGVTLPTTTPSTDGLAPRIAEGSVLHMLRP
jgi:hypothetical protein